MAILVAGMGSGASNVGGNLVPSHLPQFKRDDGYCSIVASLFGWVEGSALAAVDWYLSEKKTKARYSRVFRVCAVVFAALGGVAPFIAVGTGRSAYALAGYPLLGAGAACIGLDKVFGFSSSWMRYQTAAAGLQEVLSRHQLKWAGKFYRRKEELSYDEYLLALGEIQKFADAINVIIRNETEVWAREFRGHFARLEAQAEAL